MNVHASVAAFFEKHNIKCFYHFTHISNRTSIEALGIFSLRQIQKQKMDSVKFLSDEVSRNFDLKKGMDGYVRLTFKK